MTLLRMWQIPWKIFHNQIFIQLNRIFICRSQWKWNMRTIATCHDRLSPNFGGQMSSRICFTERNLVKINCLTTLTSHRVNRRSPEILKNQPKMADSERARFCSSSSSIELMTFRRLLVGRTHVFSSLEVTIFRRL